MNQGTQDAGLNISAAGTTQGPATLLINGLNGITTAAAGSGVILFPANEGTFQLVYNGGASAVKVYPPVGSQINQLAVNSPHILAPSSSCEYWFLSATQLIANLSA